MEGYLDMFGEFVTRVIVGAPKLKMNLRKKISKLLSPPMILKRLSKKEMYRLLLSSMAMNRWPFLDVYVSFTSPPLMSWSMDQTGTANAPPARSAPAQNKVRAAKARGTGANAWGASGGIASDEERRDGWPGSGL